MADKIFINYRRDDSSGMAFAIYERLVGSFSKQTVFMDVTGIKPGHDFVDEIFEQVTRCKVFLVIIGPNWLNAKDDTGQRRIDDEKDFVRLEISAALKRQLFIIPILINGARMPSARELPSDLEALALRQGIEIDFARFSTDIDRLIGTITENMEIEQGGSRPWYARIPTTIAFLALLTGIGYSLFYFGARRTPNEIDIGPAPSNYSTGEHTVPQDAIFNEGANLVLSPSDEQNIKPGQSFKECDNCPWMTVVPVGEFVMGSPSNEAKRFDTESPQHRVELNGRFAVGRFEITLEQYEAFVKASGHVTVEACRRWSRKDWINEPARSFQNPGFAQEGSHPVVCVSWNDAKDYVVWLSATTARPYRLLTEAEWEYVSRAGTTTPFSTGNTITTQQANFRGAASAFYRAGTTKVGTFSPNAFGIYDMQGNVWEWAEDCWHNNYKGAPGDGSAWTTGECIWRVCRGGSWDDEVDWLRSASRSGGGPDYRYNNVGFRVARTLRSN